MKRTGMKRFLPVVTAVILAGLTPACAGMVCAAAVSAEVIEDGVYSPDSFRFEGGTGKLTITCPEFTVTGGETTVELVFSSRHIAYVRIEETQYEPIAQDKDGSVYELPLPVNEEITIAACTTAMSQPHEIEYTLYIGYGDGAEEMTAAVSEEETESSETQEASANVAGEHTAPELDGLVYEGRTEFLYADGVDIYAYEGGYRVIDVHEDRIYLVIPEGAAAVEELPSEMTVLQAPLDRVYLAATGAMALVNASGSLGNIGFSSLKADGWYVEEAAQAMKDGEILYAGKYSAPDYELLLGGGSTLAIESTMILHAPQVREKLETLGIPVFVDRSSYEKHPLGRTEWVKVYGALFGNEEQAGAFFEEQDQLLKAMGETEQTGLTIAFFYVDSTGTVVVRASDDTVPKMIELAGGTYVFSGDQAVGDGSQSSVNMSMEDFFAGAVDCDYLVYNSSIDAPISSLADLRSKSSLFDNFKAVQEGHVWCADRQLYQATDIVGELISDFHQMLTDGAEENMTFLKKIE